MDRRAFMAGAGTTSAMLVARQAWALVPAEAPPAGFAQPLRLACSGASSASAGPFDEALRMARLLNSICAPQTTVHATACAPGDVISSDLADFYCGPDPIAPAWLSDLAPLAALPGELGHDWTALKAWFDDGGAQISARIHHRETGFLPLLAGHTGCAPALWSTKPLRSLTGLRIAARGLSRPVATGLGARIVDLPLNELSSALTQGSIDAAEIADFEEALSLGIPRAARFCLEGALSSHGSAVMLGVSRRATQRIGEKAIGILAARVRAFAESEHTRRAAARAAYLRALREAYDVQFTVWREPQRIAVQRVSEAVVADLVGNAPAC